MRRSRGKTTNLIKVNYFDDDRMLIDCNNRVNLKVGKDHDINITS